MAFLLLQILQSFFRSLCYESHCVTQEFETNAVKNLAGNFSSLNPGGHKVSFKTDLKVTVGAVDVLSMLAYTIRTR